MTNPTQPELAPEGAAHEGARVDLGPLLQVGFVVRDVDATVAQWCAHFKFGEPRFVDWPVTPEMAQVATYHGKPANFRMRVGFLQAGPVQLEFIQPVDGANIYSDFLDEHGEGIHHILFAVDDPAAVAGQIDAPILQSGGSMLYPGAIWAYLDTQAAFQAMIELRSK